MICLTLRFGERQLPKLDVVGALSRFSWTFYCDRLSMRYLLRWHGLRGAIKQQRHVQGIGQAQTVRPAPNVRPSLLKQAHRLHSRGDLEPFFLAGVGA